MLCSFLIVRLIQQIITMFRLCDARNCSRHIYLRTISRGYGYVVEKNVWRKEKLEEDLQSNLEIYHPKYLSYNKLNF